MDANELRALADALEPMARAPRFEDFDVPAFCAWVRAQADAQPVAWRCEVRGDGTRPALGASDWRHYATTTNERTAQAFLSRCGDGIEGRVVPLTAAPAAPQAEPCIGNDPACPCQDGDACHYKDAADGTKAWPAPQAEPVSDPRPCTCHPDDSPPVPCARKYALSECRAASGEPTEAQIEAATVALYSYFGDEQSRLFLKSVADDVLRSALAAKDE